MIKKFIEHRLFPAYFTFFVFGLYILNDYFFSSETGAAVFGTLIIFLAPGYAWIRGLYKVPLLEEFVLASAVSISITIISLTFLNLLLSVPITKQNVFLNLLLLSVLGLFVTYRMPLKKYME